MKPIIKDKLPALHEVYKSVDTKKSDPFDELDRIADTLLPYSLAKEQGFICCYCMSEIKEKKDAEGKTIYGKETKQGQNKLPQLYMKVEHFKPRSIYDGDKHYSISDHKEKIREDLRIDYQNLLCACEGCIERELTPEEIDNKSSRQFLKGENNTFCDTHKKDTELIHLSNPADRKFFERILFRFNENGKIDCPDNDINREIGGEVNVDGTFNRGVLNLNYETLRKARASAWKSVTSRITRKLKTSDWNSKYKDALEMATFEYRIFDTKNENGYYMPYCAVVTYLLKKRFREIR